MSKSHSETLSCAQTIVRILEQHGVTHVFGVPGAKIDSLFIALKQSNDMRIQRRYGNGIHA